MLVISSQMLRLILQALLCSIPLSRQIKLERLAQQVVCNLINCALMEQQAATSKFCQAAATTNYTLTLPSAVGVANQVLVTDASGNTSWNTPNLTSYETGYVVQSVSGAVLTIRKLSGSANAADFTVGDGIWNDGIVTNAPFGSLIISAIGTASGANLPLTIVGPAGTTTSYNGGGGVRIVPKTSRF